VDGDELGPVGKRRLDLNRLDHFGNAFHHVLAAQHLAPGLHQLGDAAPITRPLEDERGNDRDTLGMVEPQAALAPPPRDLGGVTEQQLVALDVG